MRWLRSYRRPFGCMAVLALALQLGLAFGHLHTHAHHPALVATSDAPAGTAPPPPDTDDHDSHYCAIYAINALLSGAQVAAPPALPAPAIRTPSAISTLHAAPGLAARHDAFRSRAPPLA